jgi:hypothetical protein
MAASVRAVTGVKETSYRGLAYLTWPEDDEVTAEPTITRLSQPTKDDKRKVWSRFDHWIDGNVKDEYFHGWNEPGFEHCFVSKWNQGNNMQRLYGTLFHPKPKTNKRFLLCVLFSHVVKVGKFTDPAQKKKAEALFKDSAVIAAVARAYRDVDGA